MDTDDDVNPPTDPSPGIFGTQHRALTIGLVSIVTLVAFESLAVITILPDIEDALHGLAWYGWVTTAFFLGTMIGIVFAGGQADRRGAGRPYLIGLVLFAVGLVVAGAAPSMPVLVIGRFVQGFGAGVVPAIGYVAIGRVYPVEVRPRMFAVLSTAWVVPGVIGPALSERVSSWIGWRWVFLGLLPLVAVAGSLIIPELMRLRAPAGATAVDFERQPSWTRRRMVEAMRVAAGAALIVAGFTTTVWLVGPMLVAGVLVGLAPLRRLIPPGTLRAGAGLPSVVLSRGLLTFAFFGTDTFIPHALTDGRGASTFSGSIAVTTSTLGWTVATWIQERFIVRIGERFFVRISYVTLAAGIAVVAAASAFNSLPFWLIHGGWTIGGFGMGLGYAAHSQLTLRCAPAERYGTATASLQLFDNLGIALGAGVAGVVVTFGDDVGWAPGIGVAAALIGTTVVALIGATVSRRLPPPAGTTRVADRDRLPTLRT
ncbi:MAG: MFS transporter [Ilumatobacteraceae bacterium]